MISSSRTGSPTSHTILFDVNALVALSLTSHVHHRAAHAFLSEVSAWSTCATTEAGLYRLLLNPTVVGRQLTVVDVDRTAQGFRTDPRWQFLDDSSSLATAGVDTSVLVGHRQVTDLHLANLALASGGRLATFDRAITSWLAPRDRHLVHVIPT